MKNYYILLLLLLSNSAPAQLSSQGTSDENPYTVQGSVLFDADNNGCDSEDPVFPKLKFVVTGSTAETYIANSTGLFSIGLAAGQYTITPVIENSEYFSISPESVSVNFPLDINPFTQNFCITPIGSHDDDEVTIVPLTAAIPGSDVKFKIIYNNKGSQPSSGTVVLNYPNNIMSLVSTTHPYTDFTADSFRWDFSTMLPFQPADITVTMHLNSSADTPAVNIGETINLIAAVETVSEDEFPQDNVATLAMPTVGSFTSNDKTCLEGTSVTTEKIGNYVHYLIRFKNIGAAIASNIVITDVIDTGKFDLNSLLAIDASHSNTIRISSGNHVDFIFEGIDLPFTEPDNSGFIAFKIKLLGSLSAGDIFTNSADIYFDSDPAVSTDTASTTIQALATNENVASVPVVIFPNPAGNAVNVAVAAGYQLQSIFVVDQLGRAVISIPDARQHSTVDVSQLSRGGYFMKISANGSTWTQKFLKQ